MKPDILVTPAGVLNSAEVLQVGQSFNLQPGQNNGDPGEVERLFQLPGNPNTDQNSQMVTVFFEARPVQLPGESAQFVGGGPVVGILEFSTGGGNLTRIEFDVPLALPQPSRVNPADFNGPENQPNGVSLTVPASGLIASARLDSKVEIAINSGADPIPDQEIINPTSKDVEAIVSARIGYGTRSASPLALRRTQWLTRSGSAGMPDATGVLIQIPNHAIAVEFPRFGGAVAGPTTLRVQANNFSIDAYNIIDLAINDVGPINLSPNTRTLTITNNSGAVITALQAVYTIAY